jgi:hypothetical protein
LIVTEGAYNLSVQSANETTSNTMSFQVDTASSSTYAPTLTTITATVTAGSSANYPVTLPSGVSQVTVACLNLPTGASCSYSNGAVTITTSSTTPKGTYTVTVVFTETATVTGTALILAPFLLLPLWFLRKKLKVQGAWITACMAVAILAGTLLATTGCGGSSSKQTSPVTSSSVVTLTVQ